MKRNSEAKSARILSMYARLISGKVLNRRELAEEYGVTARSVQRDVEDLRCFLAEQSPLQDVVYDRTAQGYRLTGRVPDGLSNSEILAVCKILLESRSMRADEMLPLLDKLITCAVPEESRRSVKALISNEQIHYIPPQHNPQILDGLWELGQAVRNRNVLEIAYTRMKEPKLVRRRVQPVGLMFSEYYFYLTAFLENRTNFENPNDLFPTIYRIDRIQEFKVLDEHFQAPYRDRFEEGEFRKRVQFMYGGRLETIRFRYAGLSLEAVLDRLPTAKVLGRDGDGWLISAEVFGKGINMWLRSQGDLVQILED